MNNITNKNIRIFQVFNSRRMNGKMFYLVRTENQVYKYFETDNQIPWVEYVACIHADENSDEVIFLGKIEDFKVVNEDYYGLSENDIKMINNNYYTIINSHGSGIDYQLKKIVLGEKFKQNVIREYKNKYGCDIEISGNYLSKTESKLLEYINKDKMVRKKFNPFSGTPFSDGKELWRISNLEKIFNDIKTKVESLNIESIIDSYHIRIESEYINKVGGDDTYRDYYVSECEYTDNYICSFLPCLRKSSDSIFDSHYPIPYQEKLKMVGKCKEMELSSKECARKKYNREKHVYVLFAFEIMNLQNQRISDDHNYEMLKQYIELTWGLNIPNMPIDNSIKKRLAEHNKGRNVEF